MLNSWLDKQFRYYIFGPTRSKIIVTHLFYQVVGLTDIADRGSDPISLNLNIAVTEQDEQDNWDHTPREPCWYFWWGCHFRVAGGKFTVYLANFKQQI